MKYKASHSSSISYFISGKNIRAIFAALKYNIADEDLLASRLDLYRASWRPANPMSSDGAIDPTITRSSIHGRCCNRGR